MKEKECVSVSVSAVEGKREREKERKKDGRRYFQNGTKKGKRITEEREKK